MESRNTHIKKQKRLHNKNLKKNCRNDVSLTYFSVRENLIRRKLNNSTTNREYMYLFCRRYRGDSCHCLYRKLRKFEIMLQNAENFKSTHETLPLE